MTCLILRLPGAITDTTNLPRHYDDDGITPGTLMLWEPGSPIDPVTTLDADPAAGKSTASVQPNLAADIGDLVDASAFTFTGSMSDYVLTVTAAHATRKIHIGDLITGTGVPANTRITKFNTGSGGTGTYAISTGTTVSSTTMTSTPPTDMVVVNNGATSTDFVRELTTKGALHVITSQSTMATFRALTLQLPGPIKDYLYANPTHEIAWSAVYRVTRVDANNTAPYVAIKKASGASNGWFNIGRAGPQGITGLSSLVATGARNTLGLVHERAVNAYDGTALSNAGSDFYAMPFGFGYLDTAYGDAGRNKCLSAVLYRIVIEDLTVSGRSFAAFGATEDAMREAMFASGGRYYGDTYTDPSALP